MSKRVSSGAISARFGSADVLLTYADCDPAGILYFATWFPWMERILTGWMHDQGLRSDELLESHGFALLTRQTECEYLQPASLFDTIRVSMDSAAIGRTSICWGFSMARIDDDAVVSRGKITWVTIDATGTPTEVPPVLQEAISQNAAR